MAKKGFPTFAVIVLVLALLWLLGDMGLIAWNVPFFPLIIVIIALGWVINHYTKEK